MYKKTLITLVFFVILIVTFYEKIPYPIFMEYKNKSYVDKRISNLNSSKKIILKINTNYNKIIISKDNKGSVSNYRMVMETNIQINYDSKITDIIFKDNQDITNISDIFEQKNYENTIKKNFAITTVRNLSLKLLNYK